MGLGNFLWATLDNNLLWIRKLITSFDKFSVDVDIVVLNNKGESGNRLKNKLKAITEAVSSVMPEVEIEGITCLLYTSPSPRDRQKSRMPSSA